MAAAALGVKLTGNIDNEVSVMGPISSPEMSSLLLTDGSAEGFLIDKISGRYYYAPDGSLRLTEVY